MVSSCARERMSRRPTAASLGLFALVAFLWIGVVSTAWGAKEEPVWQVAPRPSWVETIPGPRDPDFASAHPGNGLAYEVLENQHRIVGGQEWSYGRTVVRILSEAGTETAGQQSFEFSPPNQRLVLHSVRIHRGDETLERLDAKNVQLLQREANLDKLVYDNRRTAFVLIPDLRVGDVLEYDWSVVGANPVLEGHTALGASTQRTVAVGVSATRILVDHELSAMVFGSGPEVFVDRSGPLIEYTVRGDSVPAAPNVENVPVEEQYVGWVQFTDFDDWKGVARWGIEQFEPLAKADTSVGAVLEQLDVADATVDSKVLAVLQWVQSEVRYFSLPFSVSTHRPAAPSTVLERRYGDCKDVALLTVVLLRELGIPAQVALVDADGGRFVPAMLPSVFAFDHAIVVAFPHGTPVWLDPTASYQAGSLDDVAARDLHWALPLAPDVPGLVPVEEPARTKPDLVVQADYTSTDFDAPATLKLEARYAGRWAEWFRYLHETRDDAAFEAAFAESLEQQLRDLHAGAESTGPLLYTDHSQENVVVLRREYSIPELWTAEDGQIQAAVEPFTLYSTTVSAEPGRTLPLAVPFPDHRRHVATLVLPKTFEIEPEDVRIAEGPLLFTFSSQSTGDVVELEWSLGHTRHRAEVEEFEAYREALERINERMRYWLWDVDPAAPQAEGTFNWMIFLVGAMWVLILGGGCLWVFRARPYLRRDGVPYDAKLVGLNGWLVLVAIGLVLGIPRVAMDIYQVLPSYSNESWNALTAADSPQYDPLWAPILLFELLANLLMLALALLATVLYFKKHRSFPVIFIAMHLCVAVLLTVDDALMVAMFDAEQISGPEIVGRWLRAVVWTAYAIRSVRVRSTFLPPPASEPSEAARRYGPSGSTS
ncbi:MAG: DUF2569 family protein [Nannocystaceae bacterium]|nr:DUF2569 family protein [bacterium]